MNERDLIDRCLKNNREAQQLLYDTYSGQMYSICLRYCGDRAAAADALQNGFINVFKHLSTFKGSGSVSGWIRKIVIRSSLLELRKRKGISFVELSEGNQLPSEAQSSFDNYDYNKIISLIEQLPDGYRAIFSMFVIDDMTHKEISEALKITENTSRSQLQRARKILQKQVLGDAYLERAYSLKKKIHTS